MTINPTPVVGFAQLRGPATIAVPLQNTSAPTNLVPILVVGVIVLGAATVIAAFQIRHLQRKLKDYLPKPSR